MAANGYPAGSDTNSVPPPTVIVVHPKENRAKCSVERLRGRTDLCFMTYSKNWTFDRPGYIRLSVDGPRLSGADAEKGILLIDGAWRHVGRIQPKFADVPPRSLAGFRTAYPRVSKLFDDPAEGLASVEALYVAYRVLGRPVDGLLDGYYWREEFLRLNGWS